VARGLLPEPPELAVVAEEWSVAELFWITKHGIRMTGMPAFGPTHSDAELWEVVAFLRVLPALTPEAYRALLGPAADGGHDGHGHEHSHGEE
jgi:mono/diheme cytochrome c family protein